MMSMFGDWFSEDEDDILWVVQNQNFLMFQGKLQKI